MKRVLKYLITILIIVGIVFGAKTFVGNKTTTKVYTFLDAETLAKIDSTALNNNLSSFDEYYTQNEQGVPDSIKTSWTAGEMSSLISLYADCSSLVNKLKQFVVLELKQTNSLVSDIKTYISKTTSSMQTVLSNTQNLVSHISNNYQISQTNYEYYYNQLVSSVNTTLNYYSNLANSLANFVLQDVYSNASTNLDFIKIYLQAHMINFASVDSSLISDYTTLKTNIGGADRQQFVVEFNACSDVDALLKSTNKQQFATGTTSYQYLAKVLFNVTNSSSESGEE